MKKPEPKRLPCPNCGKPVIVEDTGENEIRVCDQCTYEGCVHCMPNAVCDDCDAERNEEDAR